MKKYRLEIMIFIINAIYMILELIASRLLSPYFGNSNIVWTCVIGIILLSTSIGNFIGGKLADKEKESNEGNINIKFILLITAILILAIPIIQSTVLNLITSITSGIRIGAIFATVFLFFLPSMCIGMLSPIVVKLRINDLSNTGSISGRISALATLGSIFGTFLGGFLLIPNFGSNQILYVLAIITFILVLFINVEKDKQKSFNKMMIIISIVGIIFSLILFVSYITFNHVDAQNVKENEVGASVSYDTQYGSVVIKNVKDINENEIRTLSIDRGNESATYIDNDKHYDLVYEYTKFYDLMFNANIDIKDTLMIGGAGYSYPKYFISNYEDLNMDVVEIDEDITSLAKEYFYLDELIDEFDLNNNNRLNIYGQDGRVYLNQNEKKYDAILNDAFSGESPAVTLTTIEAVNEIHEQLNENGIYLTNIISSLDGKHSSFLKSEVKTLKEVFKNVYVVPCNYNDEDELIQNFMVIATDDTLVFDGSVNVNLDDSIVLTDNYCPVETLIPKY